MRSLIHSYASWLPSLVALILYLPSLTYDYVYDDGLVIKRNSFIQEGISGIADLWTHTYTYGVGGFNDGLYRPVSTTLFALAHSVTAEPWLGHLINVLLYAGAAWVLFQLLSAWKIGRTATLIGTLLFVVHPLHTEAVANIKSADELCALLFGLLALKAVTQTETKQWSDYGWISLFFLLALLSKESAIGYAVLIPLTAGFRFGWKRKDLLALTGLTALVSVVWYAWHSSIVNGMENPVDAGLFTDLNNVVLQAETAWEARSTGVWITFLYLLKMLWPWPLVSDYSPNALPVIPIASWQFALAASILTAMLVWAILKSGSKHLLALGIFFFFVLIAPVSNVFIPIGTSFGERLALAPSLWLAFAGTWCWPRLRQKWMPYAAIGIVLLGSVVTLKRSRDWRSEMALYAADVVHQPNSFRTNYNYGTVVGEAAREPGLSEREKQQLLQDAATYLKRVLEIKPEYPDAINNLANIYERQGKPEEALKIYTYAYQVDPNYALAMFNAGVLLVKANRHAEAHEEFQRCIATTSAYQTPAWYWSGVCSGYMGEFQRAIQELRQSLALEPAQWEAWNFLGMAYGNTGQWVQARQAFEQGLRYSPNNAEITRNLQHAVQQGEQVTQ